MNQASKQSTISARIAVNRDYQPARIERELLAQIFDLVEQRVRKNFTLGDVRQQSGVSAASAGSTDHVTTSIVSDNHPTQIMDLEEVA